MSGANLLLPERWLVLVVQPAAIDAVDIACRPESHMEVRGVRCIAEVGFVDPDMHCLGRHHAASLGGEPTGNPLSNSGK